MFHYQGNSESVHASISGTSSAYIFASATGLKWNLQKGTISWVDATISTYISLIETASATVSRVLLKWRASSSNGMVSFAFRDRGHTASVAGAALRLVCSDAGTINGVFAGFTGY